MRMRFLCRRLRGHDCRRLPGGLSLVKDRRTSLARMHSSANSAAAAACGTHGRDFKGGAALRQGVLLRTVTPARRASQELKTPRSRNGHLSDARAEPSARPTTRRARKLAGANRRGPRTMLSVALPAPAFASTTSVPAFWMRVVSAAVSASVNAKGGCTWLSSGRMVSPA